MIQQSIQSVEPLKGFYTFCPPPPPGRPVHSDTNLASPGSILSMQQLRATTKSLTFPPLSIARYSFIQLGLLGHQRRERKCTIFETVANGGSTHGSLDCESGIYLPLVPKKWPRAVRNQDRLGGDGYHYNAVSKQCTLYLEMESAVVT